MPSAYIVDTLPAFLWFLSSTLANVGNHNFYWKYRRTKKNAMNDYLSEKFLNFDTVALSFLFDKYCSIME